MSNVLSLKINAPLLGHSAGDVIKIKCDARQIPLDLYWRRRLKDARLDNCVEIVKDEKKSQPASGIDLDKTKKNEVAK